MDDILERTIWLLQHSMEDLKNTETIEEETKLSDLGITSIDMVKLFVYIENEFSVMFDDETLIGEDFETVGDLAGYIYSLTNVQE